MLYIQLSVFEWKGAVPLSISQEVFEPFGQWAYSAFFKNTSMFFSPRSIALLTASTLTFSAAAIFGIDKPRM